MRKHHQTLTDSVVVFGTIETDLLTVSKRLLIEAMILCCSSTLNALILWPSELMKVSTSTSGVMEVNCGAGCGWMSKLGG
jgi:hypothetical protein